jgi:subtilisin family serine protease
VGVAVLSAEGSGSTAGVIAGIDWSVADAKKRGKRAVGNMSLGGGFSRALNDAVAAGYHAGFAMIVAAGNESNDACGVSPASEATAYTVMSTTNSDRMSGFSNYGDCCDIAAPGSDITAAWIGATTATRTISGTSMASPHVCGVAAKLLSIKVSGNLSQCLVKIDPPVAHTSSLHNPSLVYVVLAAPGTQPHHPHPHSTQPHHPHPHSNHSNHTTPTLTPPNALPPRNPPHRITRPRSSSTRSLDSLPPIPSLGSHLAPTSSSSRTVHPVAPPLPRRPPRPHPRPRLPPRQRRSQPVLAMLFPHVSLRLEVCCSCTR